MAAAQVPGDPVRALSTPPGAARTWARRRAWLALLAAAAAAGCAREVRTWPDGHPRCAGGRAWLGDARQGAWRFHYPDGELREEGRYDDGRRVGTWRQWHRGGAPASEGERRFDAALGASPREGTWTFWHPDGSLRARGVFVAGRRSGEWVFRRADGELDLELGGRYVDGVRVP